MQSAPIVSIQDAENRVSDQPSLPDETLPLISQRGLRGHSPFNVFLLEYYPLPSNQTGKVLGRCSVVGSALSPYIFENRVPGFQN